jgi:uncharacterized C2H2 Zn-finger protein
MSNLADIFGDDIDNEELDDIFIVDEKKEVEDVRWVEGIDCTFHGPIGKAKERKTRSGYVVLECPHCGGGLRQHEDHNKFIISLSAKWDFTNPVIKDFFDWLSKDCEESIEDAVKEYNKQKGKTALYVQKH